MTGVFVFVCRFSGRVMKAQKTSTKTQIYFQQKRICKISNTATRITRSATASVSVLHIYLKAVWIWGRRVMESRILTEVEEMIKKVRGKRGRPLAFTSLRSLAAEISLYPHYTTTAAAK